MKSEKITIWISAILVIVSIIFLFVLQSNYQKQIIDFTVAHPLLAPVILILWRFIGVVIPPIPAGIIAFTLIPLLGWVWVFIYSSIGLLLGAIVAFLLARRFRKPLVKRFVPLQDLNKWENKVSDSTELWGFIVIRMTTGPVMDFISYLAGLTKLPFWKFLVATVLSLLPSALGYFLGEKAYDRLSTNENPWLVMGFLLSLGLLYWLYKSQTKQKDKSK